MISETSVVISEVFNIISGTCMSEMILDVQYIITERVAWVTGILSHLAPHRFCGVAVV